MSDSPVLIVGGGLAGLCCAKALVARDVPVIVLEASDAVGGRVRTDEHEGFLLDRGFQVLLTSYPEAQAVLDYDALQLKHFEPGALIHERGDFHRLVDPWRRPGYAISSAFSAAASLPDKVRVARLRRRVTKASLEDLQQKQETTTREALRTAGFSAPFVERFFEPFLGGVFLERGLETSSRMFEFVFRMFSTGEATLPADGMQAIPRQLAAGLPPDTVRLNARVKSVARDFVTLESGERLDGCAVVVATESPVARQLMQGDFAEHGRGVTCLYFAADKPPLEEPILMLNGESSGPINNVCVPSQVAPHYAPNGQSLISVSVLNQETTLAELEGEVRRQLTDWFGAEVANWRHLRTYRIPYALPNQAPPLAPGGTIEPRMENGMYVCGDHRENGSIQGAMVSGRRTAEAIMARRSASTTG